VVEEHGRQPTGCGLLGASSQHGARWREALRRHVRMTAGVDVERQSGAADGVSQVRCG
jgi:hypothetical protein